MTKSLGIPKMPPTKMGNYCFWILSFVLLLSTTTATVDPELKQCKNQCTTRQQFDTHEKRSIRKCEDYYREKKERECDHHREHESTVPFTHCRQQCERYVGGGEERQLFRFQCQQRWGEGRRHADEEEMGKEDDNPYVFQDRHFETRVKTEQGRVDVLQKFTEILSFGILVANPNSFVVKLFIVKLLNPVNLPGEFEAFFGVSEENPESFFTAFSWEILEAAFKTSRDKLERVLRKQGDGPIVKASKDRSSR